MLNTIYDIIEPMRVKQFDKNYILYVCDGNKIEGYNHLFEITPIILDYLVYVIQKQMSHRCAFDLLRKSNADLDADDEGQLYSLLTFMVQEEILRPISHDVVEDQKYKMLFLPKEIYGVVVDITNNCNLNCINCLRNSSEEEKGLLSKSKMDKLIADISEAKPFIVNISGGEPLLHIEEVKYFVKNIRKYVSKVVIYTNGTLITQANLLSLIEAGVTSFRVSVDSASPDIHNKLRGKDNAFEATIESLRLLKNNNIFTDILAVINKLNVNEIDEIRELAYQCADSITFIPVAPLGRGKHSELLLDTDEMVLFFQKISLSGGSYYFSPNPDNYCSCSHSYSSPLIDFDGNIYPCVQMIYDEFCLGNIDTVNLNEAWRNESLLNSCFPVVSQIEGCNSCKQRLLCNSGCRAIAYGDTGNILGKNVITCHSIRQFASFLKEESFMHNGYADI